MILSHKHHAQLPKINVVKNQSVVVFTFLMGIVPNPCGFPITQSTKMIVLALPIDSQGIRKYSVLTGIRPNISRKRELKLCALWYMGKYIGIGISNEDSTTNMEHENCAFYRYHFIVEEWNRSNHF